MSGSAQFPNFSDDDALDSPARYKIAQRTTWISAAVNLLLTVLQILVGWLAHSQSLIAHGIHSFSDLLSDFLVLFANRQGNHPADQDHPYGHARIETAATLILGVSLCAVGAGILWDGVVRLQQPEGRLGIELAALWVAVGTVVAKEGLYRYLIAVADRLRSRLMAANAMHTRADAASALVVVAGVGGALLGWPVLDLVAALLMGFMILKLGIELSWGALRELIDEGLSDEAVRAIRETLASTPGVVGVHELRSRRMANRALVDAHVQVDGRISVSEGHYIAERARGRVLRRHPEVLDVLVHIDAEEDIAPRNGALRPPERAEIEILLGELLPPGIEPRRVVLHYLGGRVEVEIVLPARLATDATLHELELRANEAARKHVFLRKVRLLGASH